MRAPARVSHQPSVFRNIFSANTLFRSASFVGLASLTRQTRANVPLDVRQMGKHVSWRRSFPCDHLPVPSVLTLAKSSNFNFLEVLDASLGAPGATTPLITCALSRLLLAPAWPTVAGTWWATVAAIWRACVR